MSILGPRIIKVNGGLGQQAPSDRNVAGLIIANGYEVSTTFVAGGTYELNSIDDALALGLNKATDANGASTGGTSALPWYHISEFFRLNPDGKLWVINGDSVAAANIFTANGLADQLMNASGHSIRFLGVVLGIDPATAISLVGGYHTGVTACRTAAQTWLTAREEAFLYVDMVVIEGYGASATLVDNKTADAPGVLITVANDKDYVTNSFGVANLSRAAAVGMVLGSIGVRMRSESIASVVIEQMPSRYRGRANYSIVDAREGRWLKPALTTGAYVATLSRAVCDDMRDKAYSFADQYNGYEGVYLTSEATCTTVTDDFNTIHANRVWNEAARRVRRALVPRMSGKVKIDGAGKIKASTIADWDASARRELESFQAEGEIAGFQFTMDPNQDVTSQGMVKVGIRVIMDGIAKDIEAELGFTNLFTA